MCNACEKELVNLHEVSVFDLTDTEPRKMNWEMCQPCLESRNLWCPTHGLKVLLFMPDTSDKEEAGDLPVFTLCWQCCRNSVGEIDSDQLSAYAEMVRNHFDTDDFDWVIQAGSLLESHTNGEPLSDDGRILAGASVIGVLTGHNLNQTLVLIATEGTAPSLC